MYVLVVLADEVNLDVKRKLHLGRVYNQRTWLSTMILDASKDVHAVRGKLVCT